MPPEEDRATTIGKVYRTFGEDQTCSSEDMIAVRQTHRHAHHNTLLPRWGRSNEQQIPVTVPVSVKRIQ